MKVLQILGKLEMDSVELSIPEPELGEVRIKVAFAGVCGSDLHYYFEGANGAFVVKEPLVPGHELSGIVDFDPSGEFPTGLSVTIHPARFGTSEPKIEERPHLWPGGSYLGSASTWPHTQGGMTEYLIVRKNMVRELPAGLDLATAALAEPLAVALHALNVAGGVADQRVLISGSGPIGLLVAAAAKVKGATEVVTSDLLEGPLNRAIAVGASRTIKIGRDEFPENYFDIVFECSGVAPAITGAITAARRAGLIVQVGMLGAGNQQIVFAPVVVKELTIKGAFRFNNEIDEAVKILAENSWISSVITHTFALEQAQEAFEIAKDSQTSGKVLIQISYGELS